jgi:seryl-tRNA synthetase
MLDIEFIRTNKAAVADAIQKKSMALNLDELLSVDEERRSLITKKEELLAKRNQLSVELAKEQGPAIKQALQDLEPQLVVVEAKFRELMMLVPQIPSDQAPVGDESASRVVKAVGEIPTFDFQAKDHIQLGESLDLIDFDAGRNVSGFRGYYLKNDAVLLEYGLLQLGLRLMREKGFSLRVPPTIVRSFALEGSGHFPFGKDEIYQIANPGKLQGGEDIQDAHYLAGTAESSLLAEFANKTFKLSDLPIKVAGISPCYRSEIGSYSKDVKGLYRIHEFMKVEQVMFCEADDGIQEQYLQDMLGIAEEMLALLELPYRVLEIATGDMGAGKFHMYDIETWMPSRNAYGETHSDSALGDWQSRRLGIKYLDAEGKKKYAFALNCTVVATPRILIPLLENHQQADGSIKIPKVLQEFVGKETIQLSTT